MDKISIIIPCYNVEAYIEKCITSIKEQTYTNYEVILVDDGSKDTTGKLIKELIQDDQRFYYFYKENGGQADARNDGIEHATGEYVTFVDSDDSLHKEYLSSLYEALQKDKETMIAACYFERIYQDRISLNEFTMTDMLLSKYPAVWGKLFRRELLDKTGLRFPKNLLYEDLGFFTMLCAHVDKIAIVDQPLYDYMQNPNSTMYTYNERIFEIYPIMDIVHDYYEKNNCTEKYQSRLEYIMVYHVLVGTIFRASFMDNFSSKEIKKIVEYVVQKYPKWYKNPYIKSQMSMFYRGYLFALRLKCYRIVTLVLRIFNKKVSL